MVALVILGQFVTAQAEFHECDKLNAVSVFPVPEDPVVELFFQWTISHCLKRHSTPENSWWHGVFNFQNFILEKSECFCVLKWSFLHDVFKKISKPTINLHCPAPYIKMSHLFWNRVKRQHLKQTYRSKLSGRGYG